MYGVTVMCSIYDSNDMRRKNSWGVRLKKSYLVVIMKERFLRISTTHREDDHAKAGTKDRCRQATL
jgi:hypothetical protein